MRNRLLIFPADESVQSHVSANVTLKLGEILEPLAEAYHSRLTFVEDFANDDVQIPADLYEALIASISILKSA